MTNLQLRTINRALICGLAILFLTSVVLLVTALIRLVSP